MKRMKKMNKKELFEKMVEMGVKEEVMEVLKGYILFVRLLRFMV